MVAGLSSYCSSVIPSTISTFFVTGFTDPSNVVKVGASFSCKPISAVLLEQ